MFENKEGQRVPAVTFRTREGAEWKDLTSDELFGGKTVIVFSLPGAFTPTCSSSHVPRFDQLAKTFKRLGVDEIVHFEAGHSAFASRPAALAALLLHYA